MCQLKPHWCAEVDKYGKCTKCLDGYYLDQNNNCLPSNCAQVIGQICVKCNDGYYLDNNNYCQMLPQWCAEADKNGKCTKCLDGYYLNENNKCIPTNCALVIGQKCVKCNDGYYLDNSNNCQLLPQWCAEADKNGKCTKCLDGYYLDQNNKCLPTNCAMVIGQKCVRCNKGYYLDNNSNCQLLPQ